MAYRCDTHDDRTADVLITNLNTGDTATLCGAECLPAWVQGMAAMFGIIPDSDEQPEQQPEQQPEHADA